MTFKLWLNVQEHVREQLPTKEKHFSNMLNLIVFIIPKLFIIIRTWFYSSAKYRN